MKRTLVAAVLLSTAAAAVVTLPAFAGQDAAPTAPAADQASPEVLSAMERDLGLTRDAALARLDSEAKATALESDLRGALTESFGGAYYDAAAGKLVVGVTDAAKAADVRARGANATVVKHSAKSLDATAAKLDAQAATAPRGVTGWYVDVQRNTVTLTTAKGSGEAAKRFAATVDGSAISVVESTEAPRTLYDVRGGDAYYIGSGSRCSVGFSVQGGFVSAGHCGTRGASTSGSNRVAQGTFQGSSFPGNDYSWVKTNTNWTPRGVVNRYSGSTTVAVKGSTEAAVGASVCRSGSTTGWHCGTVQSKNQTVNYSQGAVNGLTRTNACAEPGDSGGSWLSGSQAQGVTSGGSGNCSSGGTTYFQPVNEILSVYGLRLVTS
ncbi:alpha-lytic protease prodomain-containing protein [Actinokineospora sp. NBRC 105648]|uniref:S1 family peptidase n=1 Tax=Actinokineospora sp. NBRC 105648 TaxID=3032206 RepID=UPI0024A48E48|nr:alpha-lytic protease prodomain-containing protein [Actinokineospora sp. NBRC 105648]GLZ41887.1 serine protease [Actinokineospora sp. NBRC 105648]